MLKEALSGKKKEVSGIGKREVTTEGAKSPVLNTWRDADHRGGSGFRCAGRDHSLEQKESRANGYSAG